MFYGEVKNIKGVVIEFTRISGHATFPGSGCSKVTMLLVNILLIFQTLISEMCQYFLLKKCEKLLHCKSFSHFSNKKISVYLVIKL